MTDYLAIFIFLSDGDDWISVPVLLAIDDLQALYGTSLYRDPEFNHIQALHLSMPRLILEYASGNSALVSFPF